VPVGRAHEDQPIPSYAGFSNASAAQTVSPRISIPAAATSSRAVTRSATMKVIIGERTSFGIKRSSRRSAPYTSAKSNEPVGGCEIVQSACVSRSGNPSTSGKNAVISSTRSVRVPMKPIRLTFR